jgi:hypothetical protein
MNADDPPNEAMPTIVLATDPPDTSVPGPIAA